MRRAGREPAEDVKRRLVAACDATGNRDQVLVFDRTTIRVNQPLQQADDPLELEPNEFERLLREPIASPGSSAPIITIPFSGLIRHLSEGLWWTSRGYESDMLDRVR